MSITPVPPLVHLDPDINPHGRRYTPEDRENGYLVWKAAGRVIARTADRLGVSEGTVNGWKRADGWIDRAKREDEVDAATNRSAIAAMVTAELEQSVAKLVALRDGAQSEKVQFDSALALLGLAGIAPVKQAEVPLIAPPRPAPREVLPAPSTPEEARQRIDAMRAQHSAHHRFPA